MSVSFCAAEIPYMITHVSWFREQEKKKEKKRGTCMPPILSFLNKISDVIRHFI
jgi:hypothetical protein